MAMAQFPLLLNGFMGTGKSTVLRLCAASLGAHPVDLDERLVARAGKSIAAIFAERGEAFFRALEQEELSRLEQEYAGQPWVVALGGGALVDRSARLHWLYRSTVVTLTASSAEILRRVQAQSGPAAERPLLSGDDALGRVERLLAERAAAYAECHGVVSTDGKPPEAVAREVLRIFEQAPVPVAAGLDSYRVDIGSQNIEECLGPACAGASGALLVSDENVYPLYGTRVSSAIGAHVSGPRGRALLEPGEQYKNLAGLERIYRVAYEQNLDRKAIFVGLGGGVVTDMTGFAAATWVRGVRWFGVPTTLLSMVDASVGGKTAVDFELAKNSVGAFWQPSGVVCDVSTLQTETQRAFVGALSEVVKTALIGDPALFELLESQADAILSRDEQLLRRIVAACVRVKAHVVALDPRESGVRAHLNLGHTLGHALESAGGYSALTHGEAVSLGLVAAVRLGVRLGHTPRELAERVERLLKRLGLPTRLDSGELERAARLLGKDKKRAGTKVTFIFAEAVGRVFRQALGLAELEESAPSLADGL